MSDLGYYFERMRELPFREVVKRAADLLKTRMAARAGYLSARFFGTRMSDTEFLKKGLRSAPDLQQMPDLVRHFRERSGPAFFISASRRDETVPLIASQFQAGKDKTIAQADKVCDHLFNLLGSGDAALGEEIDWHRDFKSAFSWSSNTYYKDIAIPYGKADIKVPWEL